MPDISHPKLQSAYLLNFLENKHEYGLPNTTMSLLHPTQKGRRMTSLEDIYIRLFQLLCTIITEQSQKDNNLLFNLVYDIRGNTHLLMRVTPTHISPVFS